MHISAGDTAWMLTSTALVFFMMPGLALFYGGLVGAKNVVATMVQSFIAIGLISLIWVIIGYSLAFGTGHWGGIIGSLQHIMLNGINGKPVSYAPTIPGLVYMAFQMKFAVITPALIAGAFCERMRFRGYLVFIALWSVLVYSPFAHAVWGGGILGSGGLHAIDFAGGSVVHELAGAAALATGLYLRRTGKLDRPHNVPLVLLGAGHPVVRLVRLQRRQRAVFRIAGRLRPGQHPARRLHGDARLDGPGVVAAQARRPASASPPERWPASPRSPRPRVTCSRGRPS